MIAGIYTDEEGVVHLSICGEGGSRTEETDASFRPFLWAKQVPVAQHMADELLDGDASFRYLLHFENLEVYQQAVRDRTLETENIRPLEAQYLLQKQKRMFEGMTFSELRRCALKIEVEFTGEFPDPMSTEDRLLSISLLTDSGVIEVLQADSYSDEREMLKRFGERLRELDPDVIEGHGIFAFDLDFLIRRCRRYRLKPEWGRFSGIATARKTRLRVAERWVDYSRCDIPGRTVFDTFLAIQIFDITARELPNYDLPDVAVYLGVTAEDGADDVSTEGQALRDLQLSRGISDLLLPTYFAQTQNFPLPLQDITLRGTGGKVDSLLLERYYHARRSIPDFPEVVTFEGGFTRSYETGVFKKVLHYDVASLYPSLLMHIGRNPSNDELGIFIPLLKELKEYRLRYKALAREAKTDELKTEYNARQQSFKILINSFYGYLGFAQARFADPELAAEVTRRGRELLQVLIEEFQRLGCTVLEADTDGIYLASQAYWDQPEALLQKVRHLMPEGLELEYDGRYPSMFCYKAKNYALFDGEKITTTGSVFRSRGIEPYLRRLTHHLIAHQLGVEPRPTEDLLAELRKEIEDGRMDIRQLLKGEYLSMNPVAYRKKIEAGGKPRRASLEVALRMSPVPRMGERVTYFIGEKQKGQTSDWQRARILNEFDACNSPYCKKYYLKKLDDWAERFSEFLKPESRQDELF